MSPVLELTAVEELRELDKKEKLTPSEIVKEAEDPKSPLHPYFTWEDTEAARLWRLEEARIVIKIFEGVQVTYEDIIFNVPEFVRNPNKDYHEQGYTSLYRAKEETAVAIVKNEFMCVLSLLRRSVGIAIAKKDDLPKNFIVKVNSILKELDVITNKL